METRHDGPDRAAEVACGVAVAHPAQVDQLDDRAERRRQRRDGRDQGIGRRWLLARAGLVADRAGLVPQSPGQPALTRLAPVHVHRGVVQDALQPRPGARAGPIARTPDERTQIGLLHQVLRVAAKEARAGGERWQVGHDLPQEGDLVLHATLKSNRRAVQRGAALAAARAGLSARRG
jgi:hypothetical protein